MSEENLATLNNPRLIKALREAWDREAKLELALKSIADGGDAVAIAQKVLAEYKKLTTQGENSGQKSK